MKMTLLLALCFVFTTTIHAQTFTDTTAAKIDSIEAKFPGGVSEWAIYLQHNLRARLGGKYLKPKRFETLRQTIIVSFLVNKEGKISEVTVVNPDEVHPKLAAEAVRVIKEGPDWLPATIGGHPVIYRQKQSITFVASAE